MNAKENSFLLESKYKNIRLLDAVSIKEVKLLLKLAFPMVITFVLEFIPGLVSVILVGHIHSDSTEIYMDGTALAVMYVNLTGISIGFGLATAMDTLCSQAFGAGRMDRLGEYFLTGCVVLSIAFVPIFLSNYFCTSILILLGQPESVALAAGQFARYTLPGLPFLFLYELMKKVLQAQNIVIPMACVALIANILNIALGYWLVYHTSLGYIGAAVARSLANASFPIMMLPYLYFSGLYKCFLGGFHWKAAIKGISCFVALGLPGMLMMCFEWWAFELVALLSGLLPNGVVSIGANAVLLNISATAFMFYLGLSVAVNIRVGNHLGSGGYDLARIATIWGLILSCSWALLSVIFLLSFSNDLPSLITNDERFRSMAANAMFIVALFQIVDSANAAMQGVFRGSGRQVIGAQINFVAYYVLGIPLACICGFLLHWGIKGLWCGMTIGLLVSCFMSLWLVYTSNWKDLANDAEERIAS